jgi:hypothetical protein
MQRFAQGFHWKTISMDYPLLVYRLPKSNVPLAANVIGQKGL